MVVGEIAIHFTEQLDDLTTNCTEYGGSGSTSNAVAAIDNDFHRPVQTNIADDARLVICGHIDLLNVSARFQHPVFVLHDGAQGLDFIAVNRTPPQHHFETVVVFGVVASCDLYATGAQGACSKVQHGGRDCANIDDLDTHIYQPANQSLR